MTSVDTLHLSVWLPASSFGDPVLTAFRLPFDAHATLRQWCEEKLGKERSRDTITIRGLTEILGWFVPEVAFMRHDRDLNGAGSRLALYFMGDLTGNLEMRQRVQAGITMWLAILHETKNAQVRHRIAETATTDSNWERIAVSTSLRSETVCGVPIDQRLWDALAAATVAGISGRTLRFRSGESRVLVPKTAQSDPYGGVELVAFPPKRSPGNSGFWSEVITVSSASFPERAGIHILARSKIRNWGPVTRYAAANDPVRSLDVFIPGQDGERDAPVGHHCSFDFRAKQDMNAPAQEGRRPLVGLWEYDESHRVFDLLRRLTGKKALDCASLDQPVIDQDGLWVLPRLGSIHKDKFLSGGSGLPWPDRQDIAESLDKPLREIGLERATPMKRLTRIRVDVDRPFSKPQEDVGAWPKRRGALRRVLQELGNETCVLDCFLFHLHDDTPAVMAACLKDLLGPPDVEKGMSFQWSDGLTVRLHSYASGPLAEALSWPELTEAEKGGRSATQQEEIRRAKRDEAVRSAERRMAGSIQRARGARTSIACALLEMPSELRDRPSQDPFLMARRELARQGLLPQVVLVDEEMAPEKYGAALRDCLRMLGVVPVENIDDHDHAPAAITVIQRNSTWVGGSQIKLQAFPLAARVRNAILECAIPDEYGHPEWMAYARAALRILSGDYGRFARNYTEDNQSKFHAFFQNALSQINARGPSVVIAEMDTIAQRLSSLQNGKIVFDQLQIGNQSYSPSDWPNLRILRTSPDPKKQPYYYHDTEAKWPSGLFGWGDAHRTVYALKAKPPSISDRSSFASQASRHPVPDETQPLRSDDAARPSPPLDEMCLAFMQPGDDPMLLVSFVHKLRSAHAQYKYDTSAPFPLHELRLLGGGVTT